MRSRGTRMHFVPSLLPKKRRGIDGLGFQGLGFQGFGFRGFGFRVSGFRVSGFIRVSGFRGLGC